MRTFFLFALVAILASGCATSSRTTATSPPLQMKRMPLILGDTNVYVLVFQKGLPYPTFLNVHDDENTSAEAGRIVIEETGGRLIELSHSGRRHLRFPVDGRNYAVDPNRIFSDAGIRATLERQGEYSPAAHQAVKQFATEWLQRFWLDRERAIVALHNTSDGTYSIESYRPGAEHGAAAADLYISPNRDRYDFFYVTDRRFFDYLKQRDYNVIFQDNRDVLDDGSLSVFFGRKGIPYLNIEAKLGSLQSQIEMVRTAREMLGSFGLIRTR